MESPSKATPKRVDSQGIATPPQCALKATHMRPPSQGKAQGCVGAFNRHPRTSRTHTNWQPISASRKSAVRLKQEIMRVDSRNSRAIVKCIH